MNKLEQKNAKELVELAFREDLGTKGDVTSQAITDKRKGKAEITAKEKGVLAGVEVAKMVFLKFDPSLKIKIFQQDGAKLKKGDKVLTINGKAPSILTAERIALNFLQRLSGIATLTAEYVAAAAPVKVLDTRKTTPGWRILEKYAVRVGGGRNHRLGLYDQILIKDNHITAAGGVKEALDLVKKFQNKGTSSLVSKNLPVEIECKALLQVREALPFQPNIIMLDNMTDRQIREASAFIRSQCERVKIEVSGGITLDRLKTLRKLDIDFVSVGALTHSAKALDLSLTLFSSRRSRAIRLRRTAHANNTTSQL